VSEPVVLFAPVDPRTDPLAQMIWALEKQRGMTVVEAHVVADKVGINYLERELLAPGEILDQLRASLGPATLPHEHLFVHRATLIDQTLAFDETRPDHAEAYLHTLWNGAKKAIERAADRRVIFGLIATRRRTMSAMQAACFQMLARKNDLLLDVRLTDGRASIQGDFFFPAQREKVGYHQIEIDPRTVEVQLIDVSLPRLGGLIAGGALETYESAVAASQRAIDALTPPLLKIDLLEGAATADDRSLGLSSAELLWYAFLAEGRKTNSDGWVVIGQDGHHALREFVLPLVGRSWVAKIRTAPLLALIEGDWVNDEDLRNLRGKTVQKLKSWCDEQRPDASGWLVPESDGGRHQRIPLPAAHIVITR
jgi:CRISPR-associated protein (TIGR02584 family)